MAKTTDLIFEIEVNGKPVKASRGETILQVLNNNGIRIPTLCYLKELSPSGACRMCVVEIEGRKNLVTACSAQVEEWMKIKTHSPKVIHARQAILELLLANHPADCLYCSKNKHCELQSLAEDLQVRERNSPEFHQRIKKDISSKCISREPSKCILCGRCIRICEELLTVATFDFNGRGKNTSVNTAFNKPLNISNCIFCGQCVIKCPTSALSDYADFDPLREAFENPGKIVAALFSPFILNDLATSIPLKNIRNNNLYVQQLLSMAGSDHIFDLSFATDLMILQIASEITNNTKNAGIFPLFSSHCAAWVKFAEQFYPEFLSNLSTVKSPLQIMGTIVKTYLANKENIDPENIYTLGITPCTASKFEASREENKLNGNQTIDMALTTRDFEKYIRMNGIDMENPVTTDLSAGFGQFSSASTISEIPGGLTEGVIRTLNYLLTGKEYSGSRLNKIRGFQGRKEIQVKIGDNMFGFAAVNGMKAARELLDEIKSGRKDLHFIEILACPGGCIGGGGQSNCFDENNAKTRARILYEADEKNAVSAAHKNQLLMNFYKEIFEGQNGIKNQEIFTTTFKKRDVLL